MVASHHASLLATRPAFDVEVTRRTSFDNSSTSGGYFGGSSGMAPVGLVPRGGLAALFATPSTASPPTPFAGSSVPEHQVGFTGYPFGNDYHSLGSEGRSSGEFRRLSGRGSQAVSIPCTPSRAKERGPSSFSVSASTASRTVNQSCSPKTLSRLHIQVGGKDESSYEPRLPAVLKRTSPGVAAIAASAADSLTPQSRSVGFRITWGDRAAGSNACGTTSTTAAGFSAAAPSRPSSFTRERGLSGLFTDLTSSSPSGSYTASPVLTSKPSMGSAAAVPEYQTAEISPLGASPGAIPAQSSRRPMQRMPLKEDPKLAMARERVLSMIEAANGLAPPVLHQQLVFRDPALDGAQQQQQQHQKQAPAHISDAELLQQAQQQHAVFHDQLVKKAFHVAASAHQGQLRKNGEPFLVHCVETALILAKTGLDRKVVAAGLLHDTLDDSMMSEEQLQELFGEEIAALVVGVSNLSTLSQTLRDSGRSLAGAEADRMRTMILSMGDWRVVLVKLADRMHNLRTIAALPADKQRRVAAETLEVFAPLANRLGIWSWKAEIEDVCFRTLQPVEYAELSEAVRERSAEEAVMAAIRKLDGALKVAGVSFQDLHGRSKNLLSIHKKMEKKGKTLDEIFDMRGLRLIVADEASCYKALSVVRSLWAEDHRQFKDYVAEPKPNGYQSIHVVLRGDDGHPLEVQIRTAAMHHAAEYGVAAHWRYKESGPTDKRSGGARALTATSSGSTSSCSSVSSSNGSALGGVGLAEVCGESPSSLLEEGDSDSPEDEDDEAEQRHAAKRVEWLRFVLSWYCEMSDAKLRLEQPEGPGLSLGASYGHAYSATSAGCSHRGGVSNGAQSQRHSPHWQQELASFHSHGRSEREQSGGCQFPEHAADCCFRMESGMPPPELPASEAIFVVLQENNEISVKKLPGSQTTADFLENYLEQHSRQGHETQASLMVNSRLVSPSEHRRLAMGDLVQVLLEDEVVGEGPVEGVPFVDDDVDHTVGALSPLLAPTDTTLVVEERAMMAAYPGLLLPAHASSLRHCSSDSLDSMAIPGSLEEADRLTLEFHRQRLSAAWGEGVGSGAAVVREPELGLRLRL